MLVCELTIFTNIYPVVVVIAQDGVSAEVYCLVALDSFHQGTELNTTIEKHKYKKRCL
jgi:hypothetical protein